MEQYEIAQQLRNKLTEVIIRIKRKNKRSMDMLLFVLPWVLFFTSSMYDAFCRFSLSFGSSLVSFLFL